jgi:hypothetical protein
LIILFVGLPIVFIIQGLKSYPKANPKLRRAIIIMILASILMLVVMYNFIRYSGVRL